MEVQLPNDFKEFLKLLHSKSVEYLLIGGFAVGYYGYPRATGVIDVWIGISPDNADRRVEALKEFDFDVPELSASLFLVKGGMVRMGRYPVKIEIITDISGVAFIECYKSRVNGKIDDIDVTVIALEHLKINKKASGRPKDIADLEHLG